MPHEYLDPVTTVTDPLLQITETLSPPNWAFTIQVFTVDGVNYLREGHLQFLERICHAYPRMRFPLKVHLSALPLQALTPLYQALRSACEAKQLHTCSWVLQGPMTDEFHGHIVSVATSIAPAPQHSTLTFELEPT